MDKPEIIAPLYKSVLRHTSDMIDAITATGRFPPVGYRDWESRGDEDQLPRITLLGVEGFGFRENQGLWDIRFGLGISSYRDTNLLNEIEMISYIQNQWFGEGCKVPLLNELAEIQSELVSTDFEMLPMSQSEIRNYRTLGVELKRTGT